MQTEDKKLDWHKLYFGHMPIAEVLRSVDDDDWQVVRISMKGKSLEVKYNTLLNWLIAQGESRKAKVQVTNYVTALSRGGLIKPKDYREVTE